MGKEGQRCAEPGTLLGLFWSSRRQLERNWEWDGISVVHYYITDHSEPSSLRQQLLCVLTVRGPAGRAGLSWVGLRLAWWLAQAVGAPPSLYTSLVFVKPGFPPGCPQSARPGRGATGPLGPHTLCPCILGIIASHQVISDWRRGGILPLGGWGQPGPLLWGAGSHGKRLSVPCCLCGAREPEGGQQQELELYGWRWAGGSGLNNSQQSPARRGPTVHWAERQVLQTRFLSSRAVV